MKAVIRFQRLERLYVATKKTLADELGKRYGSEVEPRIRVKYNHESRHIQVIDLDADPGEPLNVGGSVNSLRVDCPEVFYYYLRPDRIFRVASAVVTRLTPEEAEEFVAYMKTSHTGGLVGRNWMIIQDNHDYPIPGYVLRDLMEAHP